MFQRDSDSLNAVMRGTVRRIPSALTVIALAVVLTACGGGGGGDETTPVSISTQPSGQSVTAGSTVRFSVQASGTGLTYQWQRKTSTSAVWTDISGATSSTLELTNVTTDQTGHQFRVLITGKSGSATSDAAVLTVTALTSSNLAQRSWTKGFAIEGVNDNISVCDYDAAIDDNGISTIIFVKSDGSRPVLYATRGTPNDKGADPTFTTGVLDEGLPIVPNSRNTCASSYIKVASSPVGNVVATWTTQAHCNSTSYDTDTTNKCYYQYARRHIAGSNGWESPILVASTPTSSANSMPRTGAVIINDAGDMLIEVQGWERTGKNYSRVEPAITWKSNTASTFSQYLIKDKLDLWRQHLDNKGNILLIGQASQNSTTDIVAYRGNVNSGIGSQEILDQRSNSVYLRESWSGINGHAVVMWNQDDGNKNDIRFAATLDSPSGSWSTPTALSLATEWRLEGSGGRDGFYGSVSDAGEFVLYRNGWRVQRVKGIWGDYTNSWNKWTNWSDAYGNTAMNREGSVLKTSVRRMGDNSWATFDGPAQAIIHAFPASENVAAQNDYLLGVPSRMDGITLLAKNGIGFFVSLNSFDVLPAPGASSGDSRDVDHLWALYFK